MPGDAGKIANCHKAALTGPDGLPTVRIHASFLFASLGRGCPGRTSRAGFVCARTWVSVAAFPHDETRRGGDHAQTG